MTAIKLLESAREEMNRSGDGIAAALWIVWRKEGSGISTWNSACRALVAYADPLVKHVSHCHLYGYLKSFERRAPRNSQLDAIDYAVDYLRGIHAQIDGVIDPRD